MIKKIVLRMLLAIVAVVVIGLLNSPKLEDAGRRADNNSYNHETFWYEGWGTSIYTRE